MTLTTFSTKALPRAARAEAWRQRMSEVYYPLESSPTDPGSFCGELSWVALPRIELSRFSADALVTSCMGRSAGQEELVFIIPLSQSFRYRQRAMEDDVAPGEIVMLGSAEPYWTRIGDGNRNVTIKVPAGLVRDVVPNIENGLGRRDLVNPWLVPALGQLVAQTLQFSASATPDVLLRAEESILNLLYITLETRDASHIGQSSHASMADITYQRILSFMANHFADPELSPGNVAAALRISTRYVHKLFHSKETSFGRELLVMRLREADRLLRAPAANGRSHPQITEIAYNCGFSSQSHFSMRYKEQFGLSPRDARAPS